MTITKQHSIYLFLALFAIGCTHVSPEKQVALLNGYWEIAEIENSHGSTKEYSISQNIDFFEITQEGKGVRKKVQPDLNGNFTTSQSSQNIDIEVRENTVVLKYSTQFDTWEEEIISISTVQLILKNKYNYIYTYRRYEPLTLNEG